MRVSDVAEEETFDGIWHFIATKSGSLQVARTFPLIAHTPEAGTKRENIESGLRGFLLRAT